MTNGITKIYAIVKEIDRRLYVATLSAAQIEEQGSFGIEMIVKEWCDKRRYTLIDFEF